MPISTYMAKAPSKQRKQRGSMKTFFWLPKMRAFSEVFQDRK